MSASVVQANYDQLEQVAARFGQQGEAASALHTQAARACAALDDDGWIGRGADAFFAEMQGLVFPALQRLSAALSEAERVTREISQIMRAAEEEAAQPFREGEARDFPIGGAAASTAGGGGGGGGGDGGRTTNPVGTRPNTMAELVQLLERQEQHITVIDLGNNEYLVLLKGTDFGTMSNTNGPLAALQSGLELPSAYESQVREAINTTVPAGGKVHFVGHSLGGIVAHNLVDNPDFLDRYSVESVTTFGTPQSTPMAAGVEYNRFRNDSDPVPYLDGGALMGGDLGTQLGEFVSQTPVDSGHAGVSAHDMQNYATAPELQHHALPGSLDLSNWQTAERIASVAPEFQHHPLTDNGFFTVADRVSDVVRTVPLVIANRAINEASVFIPEGLRDNVERWTDRVNDVVLNDIPSPSEAAGGILDGLSSAGRWVISQF